MNHISLIYNFSSLFYLYRFLDIIWNSARMILTWGRWPLHWPTRDLIILNWISIIYTRLLRTSSSSLAVLPTLHLKTFLSNLPEVSREVEISWTESNLVFIGYLSLTWFGPKRKHVIFYTNILVPLALL